MNKILKKMTGAAMSEQKYTKLEQNRLEKIARLREMGIEPYPHRVERTHTSQEAIAALEGWERQEEATPVAATLVGRIRSMRPMGKLVFAHIEDGEGRIQLFIRMNEVGEEALGLLKENFDLGDFIQASGELIRTRAGEPSLKVTEFRMIAKAVTPLPAAKDEEVEGEIIRHAALTDPETRYRQRYADLAVNPHVRQIFEARAATNKALRQFFDDRGFIEVETPILQPIYGGAAARPFVTHHNQLKQDLYLRISFELYLKRLLVGGFEGVYEIGRDFRNEGVDRTHNPEFTQLEFYWAYADYQKVMDLTEEMVRYVAQEVTGGTTITYQGMNVDLAKPWRRMELSDGVAELAGIDLEDFPDAGSLAAVMKEKGIESAPGTPRGKLIDTLVGEFLEPTFVQPTFLYNYPRDISPLAKNVAGNPEIVERFEGFMAGMELCNAFTELNDPLEQEKRFIEMGRAYDSDADDDYHPMDEDYLRAMRYGMPPNGGFGIGVDRLVMLLTDQPNIREVILFPHLRSRDEEKDVE
ncbi:MAG: lysine--tRNA ligase [Anaerolineales bacterium]|nr:lysine--tRNA ligase [Anaerolineales bacterium]